MCFHALNRTQFEVIVYNERLENSELLEIKQEDIKSEILSWKNNGNNNNNNIEFQVLSIQVLLIRYLFIKCAKHVAQGTESVFMKLTLYSEETDNNQVKKKNHTKQ